MLALVTVACSEPVHVEERWSILGRTFDAEIWMSGDDTARDALDVMRENMEKVEATMGYGIEGSYLSDLNAEAPDGYYRVEDRDFYRVLTLGLDYAQFTHGAYDPTIAPLARLYARGSSRPPTPGEIEITMDRIGWDKVTVATEARSVRFRHPGVELDLGVVTRGFALDVASRVFARTGSRAGLLRLGGGAVAWRSPPGERTWRVPIEDPREPGRILLHVRVANRCLSTTGRRPTDVAEILDPRDGLPATTDLLAAVAIADSVADASALSRALFVMGSHPTGDLLKRMNRSEAVLLVEGNGEPFLLVSSSLTGMVELSPELEAEIEGRVRYLLPPDEIELRLPGQS